MAGAVEQAIREYYLESGNEVVMENIEKVFGNYDEDESDFERLFSGLFE